MARKLETQVNVNAPDSDYPYGRIRDDDGSANGTPLTEAVHGDYHQFFARILAESGVVANALPDNEYVGFQYYQALLEIISKRVGRYSIGDSVLGGLSDNLNEYINAGMFNITPAFSNIPSGLGDFGQLIVSGLGTAITQRVVDLDNGAEWFRKYTGSWSAWTLIKYGTKRVEMPVWNMDADSSKTFAHGIANFLNIQRMTAFIINDNADSVYELQYNEVGSSGGFQGITWGATNIAVTRYTDSYFDGNVDFDGTAASRGWVIIEFIP